MRIRAIRTPLKRLSTYCERYQDGFQNRESKGSRHVMGGYFILMLCLILYFTDASILDSNFLKKMLLIQSAESRLVAPSFY